jgi:hypothetical protein
VKYLSIYLNDHLAGATVGVELAKRARSENQGTPLGEWLEGLRREIEEDRTTLEQLMDRLGVTRNRIEVTAAWIAEKVGRLKPNGQLTGYSPLSPLIELDALLLGINGKLALWKVLRETLGERQDGIDLDALIHRAERQAQELEPRRIDVAAKAFA